MASKIVDYVLVWIDQKIGETAAGKPVDSNDLTTLKMIVKFMKENEKEPSKTEKCPKCGIMTVLREPTEFERSTILFDKNGKYLTDEKLKGFKACDGCLKTHAYQFYRSME